MADDSRDLLLAPGYDGKGLQNVYDISDGFISDKQISLSMGERYVVMLGYGVAILYQ